MPLHDPADALVASYDFDLPPDRIAQEPAATRTGSWLMVADRDGGAPRNHRFDQLPSLLSSGDLLVVNDTRVLPARLVGRKETGGRVELLLLSPLADGAWSGLVRPSAKTRPGTPVTLVRRGADEAGPTIVVADDLGEGIRRIEGIDRALCEAWGEMPLPPYIDRSAGPREEDRERYQTVYADREGSAAAPTAGLHFTAELFDALERRGVPHAHVTLHVGLGTFQPLRQDRLDASELHAEPWQVPDATAAAISACEARGGRVVAVGTTSCRVLESWHRAGRPAEGPFRQTRLFLHPGNPPRLAMSLLTNFHLPRSSLVTLVAAFCGRGRTLDLYAQAVQSDYRFYSYGDAMLVL